MINHWLLIKLARKAKAYLSMINYQVKNGAWVKTDYKKSVCDFKTKNYAIKKMKKNICNATEHKRIGYFKINVTDLTSIKRFRKDLEKVKSLKSGLNFQYNF